MPRKRFVRPTRFPNAIASSYARSMSRLIQQMHSVTVDVFMQIIVEQARAYRLESLQSDGALDVIFTALRWAKERVASIVFTSSTIHDVASKYVNNVNRFNKNNIADQVKRVRGIDPTIDEPWLNDFMRSSIVENVGLIKSIEQQYFGRIESIILQGVKNGQNIQSMVSELKKTADISYNRAKFIARDQTGSILGQMTSKRHQAAGVKRFEWSTSGDERVRTEHRSYDGKVYSYSKGAGSRGIIPGQDYGCRCVGLPIFDEDGE